MSYLPYNKNLKQYSRNLRNNSTLGEVLLWKELRAGKLMGYKFNRQKPLGGYIADLYCKQLNLVIEIDGLSHEGREEYDRKRDDALTTLGLKILRLDEYEIRNDVEYALKEIRKYIAEFEVKGKTGAR